MDPVIIDVRRVEIRDIRLGLAGRHWKFLRIVVSRQWTRPTDDLTVKVGLVPDHNEFALVFHPRSGLVIRPNIFWADFDLDDMCPKSFRDISVTRKTRERASLELHLIAFHPL